MSNQNAVPTDGASIAEFFGTPDGESPFFERYKKHMQDSTQVLSGDMKEFEKAEGKGDPTELLDAMKNMENRHYQSLLVDIEAIKELSK